MVKGTFGEHLQREREMRGVSLDEISAATRISTRFLEAMEDEQWERLPGGVFNRGFVRAVARFLGLDEENLVAEYATAARDRTDLAAAALRSPAPESSPPGALWLAILLVLLIIAGGWLGLRRYATFRAARAARNAQAAQMVPSAPPDLVPQSAQAASSGAAPMRVSASTTLTAGLQPSGAPLDLVVAAGRRATVTIVADGKKVFDGQMKKEQSQRFAAQESFDVSTSNSSAVLLELNGQTVAPIGPPGRPGKVKLTRKDLKKPSGGPN